MTADSDHTASSATITERLADHVVGLQLVDVPGDVVRKTKDHLVHHFGLALRGADAETTRPGIDLAFELSGADGACTVIGERRRADLLEAVFANSMLMGWEGKDDYQLPSGVHPGIVVLPAALAAGEIGKASGPELLAAVIAGYDVIAKLCAPVWTWGADVPRRPNNIVGPMGAAAAASRVLGLSRTQTVHALGHAGQAAMGITEGVEHLWTMHPLLARNGVMSAMLAKAGMPGSTSIVEGRNGLYRSVFLEEIPDSLYADLDSLGDDFEIARTETKRVAASALNFVPIELAQELVAEHELAPARVAGVTIGLPAERRPREEVWEQALTTDGSVMGRRGALRFLIAAIIADGRLDPVRYDDPPDAELAALLGKVRIQWEGGRPIRYARIEVATTGGQRHVLERDTYVQPPLDWNAWLAEVEEISDGQRDQFIELVRDLEHVADIGDVMECVAGLVPQGPTPASLS